ncbi:MAG TPA: M1 family aminopeptidase [Thermoanaerobaculia bacterium]|nr:M1 family aminopeptidase [Thermoanaerobaculia bacterium]
MLWKRVPLSAVLLSLAVPSFAQTPESLRDDYVSLLRWQYRAEPIAVPAGGLRFASGEGSWSLDSGRIWLAAPTSGGAVTGLVFEGKGRFRMNVPDAVELAQLRRFAEKPELSGIDEPITALVLRTSDQLPLEGIAVPPAGRFETLKLARERHDHWLTQRLEDVDSRIVSALASPGDRYFRVDARTEKFGWLTYDDDATRLEEIRLVSFNAKFPYPEVWVSLDRAEDRDERGRPDAKAYRPAVDLEHVDVAVDLTKAGRDKDWVKGQFQVKLRLAPAAAGEGARAVQLYLDFLADVKSVKEGDRELPFLRDRTGERSSGLDDRVFDDSLVVLLPEPLAAGKTREIEVLYELDLQNYAPGREWYPSAEGAGIFLLDTHTARMEITVRKKFEVRSMGRKEEGGGEAAEGNASTTVWVVDQPAKMLTFSFAEKFHEERVQVDGVPEVICFGSKIGVSGRGKFREVGEDVAASFGFYQQLFDAKLPPEPIHATSISAYHGQAFDGFIQLGESSFDLMGPGAGELFRGHEAAHQWWGVMVGAASYRDAWLNEAFAEYSGMMFVEATMKNGPGLFQEIVTASAEEVTGSIKGGFSKFARPGVGQLNRRYGHRSGPIGHGWRANTGELPTAYSSQVYGKGALVLHMLRGLLRDMTGEDQVFTAILRDFIKSHRGGAASTRDFEAAVARRAPSDWAWFFDQWVYRTEIPSYRWSYTLASAPDEKGEWAAKLTVRQSDVPAGFRMSVPVVADLPGGRTGRLRVVVDKPEETFTLSFPEKPRSLTFNPGYEVLARTKKD